jgi:Uma2 family endonuclease
MKWAWARRREGESLSATATCCILPSMSSSASARPRFTYAEYLAYERDSERKHEFDDGEVIAMVGGTPRHSALASRLSAAFEATRERGCAAFQADLRVRVLATGKATYPDVSMVCGPLERDPADGTGATITNPTVIVEVLSPTTESYDRGGKWLHYQLVPSLQDYLLVSQDEPRVERYRRLPSGAWEYQVVTAGTLALAGGVVVDLGRLYDDLPA